MPVTLLLDRRRFMEVFARFLGPGLVCAACGKQDPRAKAARRIAGKIPLPPDVDRWDMTSALGMEHTPVCVLEDRADSVVLRVTVPLESRRGHSIESVKLVGPAPGFEPVAEHAGNHGGEGGFWSHRFEIPKESLPRGARYLIVYSRCRRHGSYAMSQAI